MRARVQWFSEYINRHLSASHHGTGIEGVETGADLAAILGGPVAAHSTGQQTQSQTANSGLGPSSLQFDSASNTSPANPDSTGPATVQTQVSNGSSNLPDHAVARRFVDAYFRNVDGAYPFVNQSKVLENLETLGPFARRLRDSQSTLLYLVMSIGCTALERASQVPRDTAERFDVAYSEIIQECICRVSIESVQILMLLALYSLFDPAGVSAYDTVGIAARRAITTGLTRRSTNEDARAPAENELRHRLYWSIFALDRMMAVSQGLPAALADDADVPFPSLTVEEFASSERVTHARQLQTSRHVIQLRQLEGRILDQVHFRRETEVANIAGVDRRVVLKSLRASIDDWYGQGCLISPIGGDRTTIHSSATWLSARYYYLLVLLNYPNYFNSSAGAMSWNDLQQFSQRHLQATAALFQQQQLPLNCNTLYRLMPILLVLMHTFVIMCRAARWSSKSAFPFVARDEVQVALSVLEAFPEEWRLAHQVTEVVRQFVGIISGGMEAYFSDEAIFPFGDGVDGSSAKDSLPILMKPCIQRLTSSMQEMLGRSTCFQFVEYPSDQDAQKIGAAVADAPLQQQLDQQYQPHQQQTQPPVMSHVAMDREYVDNLPQVSVGKDDVMNYGWGPIDLDFL